MKHFFQLTVMFILVTTYTTSVKKGPKYNNIALENIEALAFNSENTTKHIWCCGNTGTCEKGENWEIKGKAQPTPCN